MLHKKHIWALSEEGERFYNRLLTYNIDPDLAFELVEMELGEERAYIIEAGEEAD